MRRRVFVIPRGHGFGQTAPCPSLEQLQGVVDLTDPCQNPLAGLSVSSGVPAALQAAVTPNPVVAGQTSPFSLTSSTAMVSGLPSWALPAGIAAGVLLLIVAMKK